MKIDDMRQPVAVFTNTPLHLIGTVEGFSPGSACVNSSGVINTATLGATVAMRTSFNSESSPQVPFHCSGNASIASLCPHQELPPIWAQTKSFESSSPSDTTARSCEF